MCAEREGTSRETVDHQDKTVNEVEGAKSGLRCWKRVCVVPSGLQNRFFKNQTDQFNFEVRTEEHTKKTEGVKSG